MSERPIADLERVRTTMRMVYRFLESRDRMNAAVHCQEVRYSQLTADVYEACMELSAFIDGTQNG